MWPLLALAAVLLVACSRSSETQEPEKKKEEPPTNSATPLPTIELTPEMLTRPCKYSRDEFLQTINDPPNFAIKGKDSAFAGCFVKLSEAKALLLMKKSQKPSLLEQAALQTVLQFHSHKILSSPVDQTSFLFRPDLPTVQADFESAVQRVQNAPQRPQHVVVQFDLKKAFEGKGVDDAWIRKLEDETFRRIVKTYQGEDGKRFPKLTLSRKGPEGKAPTTTLLISDRSFEELVQKNPRRFKEALPLTTPKIGRLIVGPTAKNIAFEEFRKNHEIPETIPDDQIFDFVIKKGKADLGDPGLDGIDLRKNPFEMEFGNPHLEEDVVVFVDSMKRGGLVDGVLTVGADKALLPMARILAAVGAHELGHALGLEHIEEKNNVMVTGRGDLDPRRDDSESFNAFQLAYLKVLFGE